MGRLVYVREVILFFSRLLSDELLIIGRTVSPSPASLVGPLAVTLAAEAALEEASAAASVPALLVASSMSTTLVSCLYVTVSVR